MLKFIGIVLAALAAGLGGLVAVAATRPDTFQVSRAIAIKAPPEKLFPLINSLRAFNTWNPFVKNDPNIQLAYSGPASGPGAANAFGGTSRAGTGTVTIAEAVPPSKVVMRLDMTKPLEAHNRVEFTLDPQGEMTVVKWAMTGGVPLIGKVVHLVMNMDKMVGGEFEKGLADLKTLAEK